MEEWLSGKVKNKIESGNPCLVALVGGKVAGFNLVALSSVYLPLPRETIDLKKDEGWSEQITVHKDYRGQDLATNLRYKLFAELQKNNIKWLYGATLINNKNALKLARKLGFKEIVDIHFIRFLFFKKWRRIQLNDALNGNLFLNG